MFRGRLVNEFGEAVGKYWFRDGQNSYTLFLYGHRYNGYSLEGIYTLSDKLSLYIEGLEE